MRRRGGRGGRDAGPGNGGLRPEVNIIPVGAARCTPRGPTMPRLCWRPTIHRTRPPKIFATGRESRDVRPGLGAGLFFKFSGARESGFLLCRGAHSLVSQDGTLRRPNYLPRYLTCIFSVALARRVASR